MTKERKNISKWTNNIPTGLITLPWIVNAYRVTTVWNLDVIGGYMLTAGFSAVPAVFLVLIILTVRPEHCGQGDPVT